MRCFVVLSLAGCLARAGIVRSPTPQMGWNSYNRYSCHPSEAIMKANAAGLVALGLDKLGYTTVTTDCGWSATARSDTGNIQWNATLFPAGGQALSDYIHGLGLKFGMYSGAGYFQCGSTNQPASLGHETVDAQSFATWGADSLKYDNCFADSKTNAADYSSAVSASADRFNTMAKALDGTTHNITYALCQWGMGTNIGTWASQIAGSWRISNDISNSWRSIWRITNQVVPYYKHTRPGAFPDMDMLIIGLNALSLEEERFHFGMWALNKSPLTIGAPMDPNLTPAASLDIVRNKEVIAINQDPLAKQARLIRRYTTAQWDVWLGELSGARLVVGLANWANTSQPVAVSLAGDLAVASATARDVWAAKDLGSLTGTYKTTLAGHELRLLVLTNVVKATTGIPKSNKYYTAAIDGVLSGGAVVTKCTGVDECLPAGSKVSNIGQGQGKAGVSFVNVAADTDGTKLLGVDFIHYDVALASAWGLGDNTRNMTIAVNKASAAGARTAFPVSGGSWWETGRLYVYVDGFKAGATNKVVFTPSGDEMTWAPDLIGFEVFDVV